MDQLSGGERRRMLITRTLSQSTPIVLLDEPLASLDWPAQEEVMELLSEVSERRGAIVIISLHNLNLAWLFARRSALLARGALVAEGETSATLCAEVLSVSFGARPLLVEHPKELVQQRLPQRTLDVGNPK
jgi:iron complex transport system ATP-binding protein